MKRYWIHRGRLWLDGRPVPVSRGSVALTLASRRLHADVSMPVPESLAIDVVRIDRTLSLQSWENDSAA